MIYYTLIAVSIIITAFAIYNLVKISKIEKNMNNYLFAITSERGYYIGAVLFSLALMVITAFQAVPYVFDIRVFSIVFFFFSMFLLSLSHLIYHNAVIKKCSDYKEFFKDFEINFDNKCEKLMLKHIYSKEKDIEKMKDIFKRNRHLCKEKK
ncbi:adenylate kinase [Nautilia sp. PV-1]|uniref:adenylate kinase n=1 Tax=Nautilia sp. PV-1 TaxID=2579250 RepID=UPI000FDBF69E|nr:adenylate kinase [Nautilia sp. PV-1]AZV46718.1 adenylate kinase [Nautilia sp. PV-1]